MPDPEVANEVEESNDLTPEESTETLEAEEAVSPPSLAEQITDANLDEVLGSPSVQARLEREKADAVNRAKQQQIAEARRNYGKPEVVQQAAAAVLQDSGVDPQNLTRSQTDRLNTIWVTSRQAAAEQIAEDIPQAFFDSFELPQDTIGGYLDQMRSGDTDAAIKTLVDGAVALKDVEREAAFDQRVKDETDKRVKQELKAARENGGPALPSTTRGTRATNTALALTTTEIERLPASIWTKLPDETKQTIGANVQAADAERGADTVDVTRLQRVAELAV